MSFVRLNDNNHDMDMVANSVDVNQGDAEFMLFPAVDAPLLFTEGLNPCFAIVLHGTLKLNESETSSQFCVLTHHEGLTYQQHQNVEKSAAAKRNQLLSVHGKQIITSLFDIIFEEFPIGTIKQLDMANISIIRVIQQEKENGEENVSAILQNKLVESIKKVLINKWALTDIASCYSDCKINFSHCKITFIEEKELTQDGVSNSMSCYLSRVNNNLQIMYAHHSNVIENNLVSKETLTKKRKYNDQLFLNDAQEKAAEVDDSCLHQDKKRKTL